MNDFYTYPLENAIQKIFAFKRYCVRFGILYSRP